MERGRWEKGRNGGRGRETTSRQAEVGEKGGWFLLLSTRHKVESFEKIISVRNYLD